MSEGHECHIAPWVVAPGEYYSAGVRHAQCPECGRWWQVSKPNQPWAPYVTAEEAMAATDTAHRVAAIAAHHAEMDYPAQWLEALQWALTQPAGTVIDAGAAGRLTLTGTMVALTGHPAPQEWVSLNWLIYQRGFHAAFEAKSSEA